MFFNTPFQGVVNNSGEHKLLSLISRSLNTDTLNQSDLIYLKKRLIRYLSPDLWCPEKKNWGRISADTSIVYKGVSFTYFPNIMVSNDEVLVLAIRFCIMTQNTSKYFARSTQRPKKTKKSRPSWTPLHCHLTWSWSNESQQNSWPNFKGTRVNIKMSWKWTIQRIWSLIKRNSLKGARFLPDLTWGVFAPRKKYQKIMLSTLKVTDTDTFKFLASGENQHLKTKKVKNSVS